jgi:hydroxypyruvate isomerase
VTSRTVPRLAASVSWMFAELPFLDRFSAAARSGFEGVECHYPYDIPASAVGCAIKESGIQLLGINTAVHRLGPDDTGVGALPGMETEAKARFDESLDYLRDAGGRAIHVKPGSIDPSCAEAFACFVEHLQYCAKRAARHDVTILVEPLNGVENPEYYLQTNEQAAAIIHAVRMPSVRLMFDLYHMGMSGADIAKEFRSHREIIGHVQFATAPGRHEPKGKDDACVPRLLEICALGYKEWIAAEYRPSKDTGASLGWMELLRTGLSSQS